MLYYGCTFDYIIKKIITSNKKDMKRHIVRNITLVRCGPEEEVASCFGVPSLEGAGPEDPPGVGPRLVHLPLPAPAATPAQRRRGRDMGQGWSGWDKLGAVIAGVIDTRGLIGCSKRGQCQLSLLLGCLKR